EAPDFEAEHEVNEPARVRAHQERSGENVEQTDLALVLQANLADEKATDVREVKRDQTAEDDHLQPLSRVAAKNAEIFQDQQTRLRIQEAECVREGNIDPSGAVAAAEFCARGQSIEPAAVEDPCHRGGGKEED